MSPSPRDSRPGRELVLAALFFLGLTVILTWPLALHPGDGLADLWDSKLTARILAWDYEATVRPSRGIFHIPFFHPARYVLAFSENLYGASLFGFPLLAAGASPVLNYNVVFLLGMLLSALAAWALAREVTGDPVASLLAGVVYAFLPWRMSQIPHIQFQWGAFLCLSLLFLLRYLDGGRRRDQALFAVAFGWNALCNVHYALFSGFLLGIALALHAAWGGRERWRRIAGACIAAGAGALTFVPFAIGYRKASELYHMQRYYGEMEAFSGRWTDFLSAGVRNRFWGPLTQKWLAPEGDFFPGVVALILALVAVATVRRIPPADPAAKPSVGRRRAARWLDAIAILLAVVWLAARLTPGFRLGPLSIGDPGRVLVYLSAVVLARLVLALPVTGRPASLPDWLRRTRLPRNLVLLVLLGICGIVVALGAHTPYYRFLFKSFGDVFRAIRAPARGIVLFDLALAMLAAWGLSRISRGRERVARAAIVAVALLATCVEYRAFPIEIYAYDPSPATVYRWLAGRDLPGAVVEWPLGGDRDFDYMLRQASHGKPIVNGSSGFFPPLYVRVRDRLRIHPIPDDAWDALKATEAAVGVFHFDQSDPLQRSSYVNWLKRAVADGRVEVLGSFPHGEERDLVFRLTSAPRFEAGLTPEEGKEAAEFLHQTNAALAPPIAGISFAAPVAAGDWHGGWALDDSGIAEIRVASELGPSGSALLHMRHAGLAKNYPDFAEAAEDRAGFGFPIPSLPPGSHTLTFTVIANDGGVTVLTRPITVVAPPAKPRSR